MSGLETGEGFLVTGALVGLLVGSGVVGTRLGSGVGLPVGLGVVGNRLGSGVGFECLPPGDLSGSALWGDGEGMAVGFLVVGAFVGFLVGSAVVGCRLGTGVALVGFGFDNGDTVGSAEGSRVCGA